MSTRESLQFRHWTSDFRPKTLLDMMALITVKEVIPAKVGIQKRTEFPRVKHGAGLGQTLIGKPVAL